MSVLDEICAKKRAHISAQQSRVSIDYLKDKCAEMPPPRGFVNAINGKKGGAIIAEIKRISPSKGVLFPDANAAQIAKKYECSGAACISVLTDTPYFGGFDRDLIDARAACKIPILRKDFMLDPYQIYESRGLGADCILLIMSALSDEKALELHNLALFLGMDALVETHDGAEIARAIKIGAKLIGVNARNLKTLKVDLDVTRQLAAKIPQDIVSVAESGITDKKSVENFYSSGYKAFLIGEALMRGNTTITELLG